MIDFVEQLKRRALVQWALAYLGGAWLVLQLVDVVAEPWGFSDGIARGIQISLALGFLLTIVLAWYHGERGQQRVTRSELLIVAVLLGAGGIVVPMAIVPRERDFASSIMTESDARSIAVMPFRDMSEARDQRYFGEGMAEEILNTLSRIPSLRVSARASAFSLRDEDIVAIGERLGVSTILDGSVRKEGDLVRVAVQLVDVRTESYLWTGEYDRRGGAVLEVQGEIAQEVARALEVQFSVDGEGALPANTVDTTAYDLYLRGRYQWNQRTPEAFRRALRYFDDALAADPDYAVAYAGLADTYVLLFEYQQLALEDAIPVAMAAAQRALSLDPALGEARTSMGEILAAQREWAAAEVQYKRALDENPSYATGHHWYGYFLSHLGRHEEAIAQLRAAKALDPLSAIIRRDLAAALFHARRFEEVFEEASECRRLSLQPPWCGQMASIQLRSLEVLGRYQEADRLAQRIWTESESPTVDNLLDVARVAAHLGRGQQARTLLNETPSLFVDQIPAGFTPGMRAFRAELLTALGDYDAALSELEAAMDLGFAIGPILLREWPSFDPLRESDRFAAILTRMKYP